jgi:hypothetical protein
MAGPVMYKLFVSRYMPDTDHSVMSVSCHAKLILQFTSCACTDSNFAHTHCRSESLAAELEALLEGTTASADDSTSNGASSSSSSSRDSGVAAPDTILDQGPATELQKGTVLREVRVSLVCVPPQITAFSAASSTMPV